MDLKGRTREAVTQIGDIVGSALSSEQQQAVDRVVRDLVLEAMRESAATCGHAARECCAEDEDMAHKVAREVEQAHKALVANLNSLR